MPRRVPAVVCLAVVCAGFRIAAAQSLADVARAEAERRKALGSATTKIYTNDDLRSAGSAPTPSDTTGAAPAAPATPDSAPAAAGGGTAPPQPPAAPDVARDEKYWRNRITVARDTLQRSQAFLDALQSHINGLWAEFTAMGDPYQRALIEKKRFEAIAEQDRVKADIARQTQAIAAIEDEARRAGVPAGWLR